MSFASPWRLFSTALLVVVSACTEPTQVTVVFHGSEAIEAGATSLRITVRSTLAGGESYDQERTFGPGQARWPASLPVVPVDGQSDHDFVVSACTAGRTGPSVSSARTSFVDGSRSEVHLWFDDECAGITCGRGDTCDRGRCVPHCMIPSAPGETERSHYSSCGNPEDDPIDWVALVDEAERAEGTVFQVSSHAQLNAAAGLVQPGDVVLIASDTYRDWEPVTFTTSGTAERPIIVTSQSRADGEDGEVIFDGGTGFAVLDNASWYVLGGFRFENYSQLVIELEGTDPGSNDVRLTDLEFQECGRQSPSGTGIGAIETDGRAHRLRVDHSEFRRQWNYGVSVRHESDAAMFGGNQDVRVDHNVFTDPPSPADIAADGGRYAQGAFVECCQDPSDVVTTNFDHNFVRLGGDGVNLRGGRTNIRFNRFEDTVESVRLSRLRGSGTIEGNVFSGVNQEEDVGIRFQGPNIRIVNNVFHDVNTAVVASRWGHTEDGSCSVTPPTGDFVVGHNTFVDCDRALYLGPLFSAGVCPLYGGLVTNNLFSSDSGTIFLLPLSDPNTCDAAILSVCHPDAPALSSNDNEVRVENNLYHVSGSAEIGSGASMDTAPQPSADPQLVAGCDGVFRLSVDSPARGQALAIEPALELDIDGETRPVTGGDLGADEF